MKILLFLIPFLLHAQDATKLLLMDDGLSPYPVTADLVHSYDENEMTAASWADQTGSADFEQATSGNQPALAGNTLNGYPGLVFDGSDNFMNASITLAQPMTIYLVMNPVTWTDGDYLLEAALFCAEGGGDNTFYIEAGSSAYQPRITLTPNNFYIVIIELAGASSIFQYNNEIANSDNSGTLGILGTLTIGARNGGSNAGNYKIAAVYIHNTAHDLTTRTKIINWLNTKYKVF